MYTQFMNRYYFSTIPQFYLDGEICFSQEKRDDFTAERICFQQHVSLYTRSQHEKPQVYWAPYPFKGPGHGHQHLLAIAFHELGDMLSCVLAEVSVFLFL